MDLIYEQHVISFQTCEKTCKVARFFNDGPGCLTNIYTQFICYNSTQSCFTKPGWPVKKHMIQGFAAHLRRLDKHFQIIDDLLLSCKLADDRRTNSVFKLFVGRT